MTRAPGPQEFRLDPRQVRRSFDRAANGYDESAVLQERVRLELLERLDLLRIDPAVIVDLGAGTGGASRELKRRYRGSRVVAVDIAEAMLRRASRRQGLLRRFDRVCGDAAALPLRDGSVDMVFSNLALHWSDDPDRAFAECRRVLVPGGVLTFTTYGPDTLIELRRAWAAVDGHVHVNQFIDMHDLGDALVRAGFAEPVMDVERYTLTYEPGDRLDARPQGDRCPQPERGPVAITDGQGRAGAHDRGLRKVPHRRASPGNFRGGLRAGLEAGRYAASARGRGSGRAGQRYRAEERGGKSG